MGSRGHSGISVATDEQSSPKGGDVKSPRGQLCLCSPTTHQGSFRCKFHRQGSTTTAWFKRSKSMPPARNTSVRIEGETGAVGVVAVSSPTGLHRHFVTVAVPDSATEACTVVVAPSSPSLDQPSSTPTRPRSTPEPL